MTVRPLSVRLQPPPLKRLLPPAAFAVLFALLAWVVLARHGTPYAVDTGPHHWSVAHRPQGLLNTAKALTHLGTGAFPPVAAAFGGWLAGGGTARVRRGIPTALLALVVLLVGEGLRTSLMTLLHRARPPMADWAVQASGHSFPSGHTASSAMAATLLAWGLLRAWPGPSSRVGAGICALAAAAVGLTRVYLGVHWPTDVVGGWLFAACWLTATLPALDRYAAREDGDGGPGRR
ncbi:phosphatase PAP2 family protein [Streptomyces sp. CA-111067]|uniref:phosphatase PAP2 family protein n=1 Tax=Streptomyces sp. CA-111067 TaxID=3240046 RepID=UPI003D972D2E